MSDVCLLGPVLDAVPGTVSIWYGQLGQPPVYTRAAAVTHYAASTMKAAILAALHRRAEAGHLSLDEPVLVHNTFVSAATSAEIFHCRQSYDNDDAVWERMGSEAPLRWLAERMIIRSSNLATNIVLGHVGIGPVADVWRAVGARHSVVARGIEDAAAAQAGITNVVTAADLAALLSAIALGAEPWDPDRAEPVNAEPVSAEPDSPELLSAGSRSASLASPAACSAMLTTLLAQEHGEDLAAGLPPGTRIAHKNGWIDGIRHGAGVVFPADAPPFVLAVCTTTPLAIDGDGDEMTRLLARIAAAAWSDRHHRAPD